jgi:ribose transport system ATP-binding protein
VGQGPANDFGNDRLIRLIVGDEAKRREASSPLPSRGARSKDVTLAFREVSGDELRSASFEATRGEILGIAGLAGSGVHSVSRILLGRVPCQAGAVEVAGEPVSNPNAHDLLRRSVAVLPSERLLKIIPSFTVRENYTLPDLRSFWRGCLLWGTDERRATREMISTYSVHPGDPEQPIDELSGGNRQKVALAKWLRCDPSVVVLDEPTQGVDIGAKMEILDVLRGLAGGGVTVLVCSSDIYDLTLVCERVLVMRNGRIAAELSEESLTPENVISESYQSEAPNGG